MRLFQSAVVKPLPEWHQPEVERVMTLALEVKQTLNKMSPVTNTQQLVATVFSSGETLALLKVCRLTLIIQKLDFTSPGTVCFGIVF
jgi:hypothetical protein